MSFVPSLIGFDGDAMKNPTTHINLNNNATIYGPQDSVFPIQELVSKYNENFLCLRLDTNTPYFLREFNDRVLREIQNIIDKHDLRVIRRSCGHYTINNFLMGKNESGEEYPVVMITNVDLKSEEENYDVTEARSYLMICGDYDLTEEIFDKIAKKYRAKTNESASLSWHYFMPCGKTTVKNIKVETKHKIHAEFYPWLPREPEAYFKDFLESDNNILILLGPPGTGKTSFLRHMLVKYNINAIVTYDEKISSSDKFYIDFLADNTASMLIIEDAETLLMDRENNYNESMSKILNASDGLIKLPNKKMIFTANLANDSQIDPALTRPGRCYDVIHFRELTFEEASAAAKAANIQPPKENRKYTLSELFNDHNVHNRIVKQERKLGFI